MRQNTNEDESYQIQTSNLANGKSNIELISQADKGFLETDRERLQSLLHIMR